MAKSSSKTTAKTTVKKSTTTSSKKDPKAWEKGLTLCQVATRITWKLKGDLKNLQKAYLRVAEQLVRVRDERLWAAMINPTHPSIEDYAQKRLGLKKTSLYRYLLAYDWVSKNHPEWLAPGFTGTIPDMADIIDLIWIDKELKKGELAGQTKEALEKLQQKAEAGDLRKGELGKLRKSVNRSSDKSLKSVLSELRSLREVVGRLAVKPDGLIADLDHAINLVVSFTPSA